MAHASLADYRDLMADRPAKFTAAQVGYKPAGHSAFRCWECVHFFQRTRDGHTTCEVFRSPEVDEEGVSPDGQCNFWTQDGDSFPVLPEELRDDQKS